MSSYSYEKKKRLADKISKIKKKDDMVKVLEIIYEDNKNITENQNGLFMLFHNLDDSTYHKLDAYLKSVSKKRSSTGSITSDSISEKKEYKSYIDDDFDHNRLNPNMKYSNKEKNLIKRNRYDNLISSENISDGSVVYQKFDVNAQSDSDKTSENSKKSGDSVKKGRKKVIKKTVEVT